MSAREQSRRRRRWQLSLAALLMIGAGALALPASAQWSANAQASVSATAGYPAITVNNGRWLSCRGPEFQNGNADSIGADFQAVQYLYRDQIAPVFSNFRVYRIVGGVTRDQLWAPSSPPLGDASQYRYLFHGRGTEFYNLPPDNSPMQVYVRPVYASGWLGPKSNTITIYPRPDLSQSYCQT